MKFFKADDGCFGMRAILPTLEGEQLKAAINTECDAAWRAAHPERAETLGGHDDEQREQRLADALVALINGTALGGQARTALIVTMQAETLRCNVLGAGPIPTQYALKLVDDPRTDIYAAIQETDGGFCTKSGCEQPWYRCDADHIREWDSGGLTDVNELRLLCRCGCHKHRHETGQDHTRQRDGTWTVDNEALPAFPPTNLAA